MILSNLKMRFVLATVFTFAAMAARGTTVDLEATPPENCVSGGEACQRTCARFEAGSEKLSDCEKSCEDKSKQCSDSTSPSSNASQPDSPETKAPTDSASPAESSVSSEPPTQPSASSQSAEPATPAAMPPATTLPTPQIVDVGSRAPQPRIRETLNAQAYMRERKLNERVEYAIRAGDFQTIRRLIATVGLSPTYVDSYEHVPHTEPEMYVAKVSGLWLNEIFNSNTSRTDTSGVDRVLALFIELGMDVKATIDSRTAWGPDFRTMEGAKDRASRLKALDLALQAGLKPNDDLGEQLFTELPQICGRDKSQFAIQVVDVLVKYLGPSLKNSLRRQGEQGSESIDVLLDRSFSPRRPSNAYEKEQFAQQDARWENCQPLAHRIHRFLEQGR